MLPLFPDEVGIFIGPDKVLLVKTQGGLKSNCIAEKAVPVAGGHPGDWQPTLAALDAELGETTWRKAKLKVVVCNQWVHYDVLPWSVELSKETERVAHARYLLAATYGDVVDEWTVTLSEAAPGAARLASAIPTSLLAELKTIVAGHGLKLLSLQPQLVVAYNLWRHRLPRSAAWFATIDESSLVALHLRNGCCDRVRSVRISGNWAVEMERIQTMGRLAQNRPAEGPVFVDAPQYVRRMSGKQAAAVEWLENEQPPKGTLARLAAFREAYA